MGEGMIVRRGGSGGARLRVLAAADAALLPENAKNGTVGIVSATAVGAVYAQQDEPAGAVEGDVWVLLGARSPVPVNMARKGSLFVYIQEVSLRSASAWVRQTAYVYLNGQWAPLAKVLYNTGDEIEALTGGWVHAKSGSLFKYEHSMRLYAANATSRVVTTNKIDVTDYATLEITGGDADGDGGDPRASGLVRFGLASTQTQTLSSAAKELNATVFAGGDVETLDVSGLTGEYYVYVEVANYRIAYVTHIQLLPK